MAAFLAPIPNAQELAKVLESSGPITTRAFEDEAFTARFVASDGRVVRCYTVADITIDQAELIAIECERIDEWGDQVFSDAVQRAFAGSQSVNLKTGEKP